ncbi:MAG: homoserine dehydrogenase [Clostridium sp.]
MRKLKIALLGFGNVGVGVFKIFNTNKDEITKRSGYDIEIKKVLVRDKDKDRGIEVNKNLLTTDFNEILEDDEIKIVVEVMGGVDFAKEYIINSMRRKKHIVTANKMLLALKGEEIYSVLNEEKVMLNYEASVAGGIPIIGGIEEGLSANKIESLYGIINGTTNYILSKMQFEGVSFEEALKEAKEKGYAEEDEGSDVDGYDAKYKLAILASLAFNTKIEVDKIYREGIRKIRKSDMECANEFGYIIKLLGIIKIVDNELELRVHPAMIDKRHPLANVNDSFNAVFIKGNAAKEVMFYGRGAGGVETGSAIVSDIISVSKNIENSKVRTRELEEKEIKEFRETESKYYLSISVEDKVGVLGRVSRVFGKYNISIKFINERKLEDGYIELVIITHKTKEECIEKGIKRLEELERICTIHNLIRIEDID